MTCAICESRRPKRFCPGVRADICTTCCGQEREVTVTCPFECEFLREARKWDKPPAPTPDSMPHPDIKISERFLETNQELLVFLGRAMLEAALANPGAVDYDVREALDSLVRTYRTLESGVYYETVPPGRFAAAVYHAVQQSAGEFRRAETERLGGTRTRDADVLGVLAFYATLERTQNNGRTRGRAFLGALHDYYLGELSSPESAAPSLILP